MGNLLPQVVCLNLLLLYSSLAVSQVPTCDANGYGKPLDSDCTTLFQKFTENQILLSRLFDEEQLRAESDLSWPGVENPFSSPIVQVPKYYSMKSCNFAIMPYTNTLTRLVQPLGITSWGSIKNAGKQLIADCLKKGSSTGGEVFVRDQTSTDPVLVMFMWASGAKFEAKLNRYENDPTYSAQLSLAAVGAVGVNSTNSTYTSGGAAISPNLNLPVGNTSRLSLGGMSGGESIDAS